MPTQVRKQPAKPAEAENFGQDRDRDILEAMFTATAAPVWIVDADGRHTHVSDSYADLVGKTPADCIGYTIDEVMPPTMARLFVSRHKQLLETRSPKRFEQIWPVQGEPRWYQITMSCLLDKQGEPLAVAAEAQDITQHMEQQEAARRIQATLEKRVAQRTTQLSVANEELEAFSYSVSHDLRAPLSVIAGFAELLETSHAGALDQNGKDYLHQIRTSTERMNCLIGDLLQLARVNQGGLLRTRFNLTQIAHDTLAELRASEPDRQVEVVLPGATYVDCDPGLMRALLGNLLSNAWKFTRKTDSPRIEFNGFRRGASTVFFVRDNGAGFDMKNAGRMFGAFQRFHRESEFPGTGIGLATVKRIVGRHGGQVWAESAPGLGATFFFTLDTPD